jgi:transposase-like protein
MIRRCTKPRSEQAIHDNVEVGSTLFTDEASGYLGLDGLFFRHQTVNHMAGVYSEGGATTNSVESVWALLKRGVYGVYHKVSKKHLGKYVDEFTFRLNAANVSRHTLERLDSFVVAIVGKRLTYRELTA